METKIVFDEKAETPSQVFEIYEERYTVLSAKLAEQLSLFVNIPIMSYSKMLQNIYALANTEKEKIYLFISVGQLYDVVMQKRKNNVDGIKKFFSNLKTQS